MVNDFFARVKSVLKDRKPHRIRDNSSEYRRAAVLIPLFNKKGEHRILFTKRSSQIKYHKGHISFPGGVVEETDHNPIETALRETYEEIGILHCDVEILGPVDDSLTIVPPFIVHPFVGSISYPYSLNINHEEVEKVIEVPLNFFMEDNSKDGEWEDLSFEGRLYYPEFQFEGELIWGTTASIVYNFISILEKEL